MTQRHRHWETRLHAFARSVRGQSFWWGQTDCVLIAWRALDAMRPDGADSLAARWNLRWHDRPSALALARETTLEDELMQAGATPYNVRYAQPGDVLVLVGRRLPYASVLLGRWQLSSTPRDGVAVFTLGNVLARRDALALRLG